MKTSKSKQPTAKITAQPHIPNVGPTHEPKPRKLDVQDRPTKFYTALGHLLQAVIDRGPKGCIAHMSAFRQAADLLLHPEAHSRSGVLLEADNGSRWFLLDLNHHGERFHLQLADHHAPCGGYFLRIDENTEPRASTAAFVLFHLSAILGDPTVIEARVLNN